MEEINTGNMGVTAKTFFKIVGITILVYLSSILIGAMIMRHFNHYLNEFFTAIYYWNIFDKVFLLFFSCFAIFKIWKLKQDRPKRKGYIYSAVFLVISLGAFIVITTPKSSGTVKEISLDNTRKVAKTEGSKLYFTNGEWLNTGLSDMKYIGQLATQNKAPYFILSGKRCRACDENIAVFIWSPSDGPMKIDTDTLQKRYSYPGTENDYATKELVAERRMFYGACLGSESVVWVQRTINAKKQAESSIFIVSVQNDTLHEASIKEPAEIQELLKKVKSCSELQGVATTTEP